MTKQQLKQLRTDLGLTMAQAALMVHITQSAWSRYESGSRPIPECIVHLFCLLTDSKYPVR